MPDGHDANADARTTRQHRLLAGALLMPALAVLLVAERLQPQPIGVGTGQQLGLAPCSLYSSTGIPCATCGMTTAFSHAAEGNLLAAFHAQPAGTIFALLLAGLVLVAGWALIAGMPLAPLGRALVRPRVVLVLVAVLLGGWAYTAWMTLGA